MPKLKVGDRVMLREDVLVRHARSIPPWAGYTKEQFEWRRILKSLEGKVGVVERVFPSGFVNVRFGDELIGIQDTELVKVKPSGAKAERDFGPIRYRVRRVSKPVSELGDEYILECVDFVVADILRSIGRENEIGEYPCLFVLVGDGYYKEVWGVRTNVPKNNTIAYLLHKE